MEKKPTTVEGTKKNKLSTQVRRNLLIDNIVNSGWTRLDCIKFAQEHWGLSETQAKRYYYAAVHSLIPDNPEQYRQELIARNMNVLESLLRKAIDSNNLKTADRIIRTLNGMFGVGNNHIEIEDKNNNNIIKISFGD